MKQYNTSSFTINLHSSSFNSLTDSYSIFQYTLPAHLKFNRNYYGVLHNWAKANIKQPYFLHFPTKKVYVLSKKNLSPKVLIYEEKKLPVEQFDGFKETNLIHIWLKVLLAQFLELNSHFVSSDTFYIHSELNKSQSWATVLKISLQHDYKDKDNIIFNVKDSATRLKKISLEEYQKYHKRDVPYGLSFKNGSAVFKQLRKDELKDYCTNIFVKPKPISGNKFKTKIDFHSIMDESHHEKSKSFIIQDFLKHFLDFLIKYDISVSIKKLELEKVDNLKEKEKLNIKNFKVALVDGRKQKSLPLRELIILPKEYNEIDFCKKEINELTSEDSALLVMDYNKEDFENYYPNEKDPYAVFKNDITLTNIPKQGICINELSFIGEGSLSKEEYFNYTGLQKSNLDRNLSICITQLYLKSVLLSGCCKQLPHLDLLNNRIFVYRNKMLYIRENKLHIESIDSFEMFDEIVQEITTREDILDILSDIYKYHNPFSKGEFEFDLSKFRLIISKDSIIELIDYPERVFYDDEEIKTRIKSRNKKRSVAEFKANKTSDLAEKYNEYLEGNVEELSLSYEELKTKYGKGENGFLKTVFYDNKKRKTYSDTLFRKFLKKNKGLDIKGLKEGGIFTTYTGIWFDENKMQYFVGKTHGYGKHKQDKGFQMKKILVHDGLFTPDAFFSLLNINFIRFKELTVNPYPFKLIDMKIEMEK